MDRRGPAKSTGPVALSYFSHQIEARHGEPPTQIDQFVSIFPSSRQAMRPINISGSASKPMVVRSPRTLLGRVR